MSEDASCGTRCRSPLFQSKTAAGIAPAAVFLFFCPARALSEEMVFAGLQKQKVPLVFGVFHKKKKTKGFLEQALYKEGKVCYIIDNENH